MKTFQRFDVIKMAAVLRPAGAVCHGRNKGKEGGEKRSPAFSVLSFKAKQKHSGRTGK